MIVTYRPTLEDLWFREKFLSDPDTMSYNAPWGGTIPFPREKWQDWYARWVAHQDGNQRYYRYLLNAESREFVGEIAYHLDPEQGIYLADVIVHAKYRGKGYGKEGLALLCQAAKDNGLVELYDNIAAGNPSIRLFLNMGFSIVDAAEDRVMLKKVL